MSYFAEKCNNCKNYDGNIRICESCAHYDPPITVFERITASPEVLAPHLVFLKEVFVTNINPEQQWISTLSGDVYPTKAEAIAATVAKLKEV